MNFIACQIFCTCTLTADISHEGIREFFAYLKKLEGHARVEFYNPGPKGNSTNCKPFSVQEAEYYSKYAGLAYCKDDTLTKWDCGHCLKLGKKDEISFYDNPHSKTRALLIVDSKRKEIILTFRGTRHNLKNWWLNLSFHKSKFIVGKVHSGFSVAAQSLKGYYIQKLKSHLKAHPNYKLVVTGHSLGGAAALISAVIIQDELKLDWSRIRLVTYGQPRVGNEEFVSWLNAKPLYMTRVVNEDDIVPHSPPRYMNFQHTHTEMFINRGSPKLRSTSHTEDQTCSSAKKFNLSFEKHKSAFRTFFGGTGCRNIL